MTDETRQALCSLISSREEYAFNRLKENPEYAEICRQQDKTEEMVEEYYQRFEKSERIAIRRHYEGETHRDSFELKEVYLQGLRDCFQLCAYLSGTQSEVRI